MMKIKKLRNLVILIIGVIISVYTVNGFLTLKEKMNKNPIVSIASIPDEYSELFKNVSLMKLKNTYIFKNRTPITLLTYNDYIITITKVTCNPQISSNFLKIEKLKISGSDQNVYIPFNENDLSLNYNLESDKDIFNVKLNYDDSLTLMGRGNNFSIFNVSLGGFSIVLDNSNLKEIYCNNTSVVNRHILANLIFIKKNTDIYIILINKSLGSTLSKNDLNNLFIGVNN